MPRFPHRNAAAGRLSPAIFTRLLPIIRSLPKPPIPLHIGDTWIDPPLASRIEHTPEHLPDTVYAYAAPNGMPELRAAFCERWTRLGLRGLDIDRVHVTAGATGAVSAALHAWCEPGDDVVLLAPFWPLVRGMVVGLDCRAVEVPFYRRLREGASVRELLEPRLSERTTVVYLCSPNNPDGSVLTAAQQQELADICIERDLWLLSDEAYCDYAFEPSEHHYIANLPGMAERTACSYTMSKSYALAGIRIGLLVGDPAWLETARRVTTHSVYNIAVPCQVSARRAIETGDAWVEQTRDRYRAGAELVARELQADFLPAQGGGYVFADLSAELGDLDTLSYLAELLHEGVSLSPGVAFGDDFASWVRVCYMSVELPALKRALDILNRSLDRLRRGERLTGLNIPTLSL